MNVFLVNQNMMKLPRNIAVAVFALFLVGAALGQGFWANTVFCISGTGHAAFEPVHNGIHAPRSGELGHSHHIYELSSGPGLGFCFDIPVFENESCKHSSFEWNPDGLCLSSAAQRQVSDTCIQSIHSPDKTADFFTPTLLSLRSKILLI